MRPFLRLSRGSLVRYKRNSPYFYYPTARTTIRTSLIHYDKTTGSKRPEEPISLPIATTLCISIFLFGGYYQFLYKPEKKGLLNPETFSPYLLESKESVSPTSSILKLISGVKNTSDLHDDIWKKGIWSVQFKQPLLQIARLYTPLPPPLPSDPETLGSTKAHRLRFLIRHSGYGEVSNYLKRLVIQQPLDIRGPQLEYEFSNDVNEVLFLAGGTGVVPALQTIYTFFEARKDSDAALPRMHILWANRAREDCVGGISNTSNWYSNWRRAEKSHYQTPEAVQVSQNTLVEWVARMNQKYPNHITIDYFVDEEKSYIDQKTLRDFLDYRRNAESLLQRPTIPNVESRHSLGLLYPPPFPQFTKRPRGKKLILIAGPDGFIDYLAGPKKWENGQEKQGDLGGLLGRLDTKGWEVWKL